MEKIKEIKNKREIILILIIILLLITISMTNTVYYMCYTINYLLNRNNYTFKEEGQFKENKLMKSNNIFETYMKYHREKRLLKMVEVDVCMLPELKIDEICYENVHKISNGLREPFVIRGLLKEYDCVKKWDLEYFKNEFGNIEVPVYEDGNINYGGKEQKLKKSKKNSYKCSISDIVDGIKNGEPLYVNNISRLFSRSKKARSELNLNKIEDELIKNNFLKNYKKFTGGDFFSQLFFGGKNTGTNLHCASNINFFFMIKGKKRWGFIHPKYTDIIDCQTSKKGLYSVGIEDYFAENNNKYSKIPRMEIILNEGDFLYNPAWYWHAVKNESNYTIAVANRFVQYINLEIPTVTNNLFFSYLQGWSPMYYLRWLYVLITGKPTQENFESLVDGEILENLTKNEKNKV